MSYHYTTNSKKSKKFAKGHGKITPEVCSKRMYGKTCEYCVKVAQLYQSDNEEDSKLASRCRARSTFYMNIIDLNNKDAGVQVYGCGIEIWRTLIDSLPDVEDSDDDGVDYTNPKTARRILVKRKGSGLKTKYTVSTGNGIKVKKSWFKNLNKLDKIIELLDSGDIELWKPSEGKNKIYIFPPWSKRADGDFFFEVPYHWNTELLSSVSNDDDDDGDTEEGDDDDFSFSGDDDDEDILY